MDKELHRIVRLIITAALCWFGLSAYSADMDLLLGEEPALRAQAQQISAQLTQRGIEARVLPPGREPGSRIALVLGEEAARQWRHQLQHYRTIVVGYLGSAQSRNLPQLRAHILYSDQPLERQLALARVLLPRARSAGALYAEGGAIPQPVENHDAWNWHVEEVTNQEPLAAPLQRLLRRIDVLVAQASPSIYNADNLRTLLLTSYHHRIPLVGPSKAFVDAGALASVYTPAAEYRAELVHWLQRARAGESLPRAAYPQRFAISINTHVAQSLGLPVIDSTNLHHAVDQLLTGTQP